ncbi:MAG: flagellar basal body rod protein FlgB [Candidatus Zixiibacteriota bacterium]
MESKLASFLFSASGVPRYRRFLDLSSLRHKLISSNVANVSTPGYRNQDIEFDEELAKSSGQSKHLVGVLTDTAHIPLGRHPERMPKVERTKVEDTDLNSVDIDREVPKMAQNELEFTVAARLLQKKFEALRRAIVSK